MTVTDDAPHALMSVPGDGETTAMAALRVLASGSRGNCTALAMRRGSVTRLCLIDLGLSPRRTFNLLARSGFGPEHVDDIVLTHLDHDHVHSGWRQCVPAWTRVHTHQRHARRAASAGFARQQLVPFLDSFTLQPGWMGRPGREGVSVRSELAAHDENGVAAFRFDIPLSDDADSSVGFATDLGRVTVPLVNLLSGVDLLAIESNYCPKLQAGSARPEFLKRRITGGAGHLSNHECFDATQRIAPRTHVVLLHLSRECNRPTEAAAPHEGSNYALTISDQDRPTPWIRLQPARGQPHPASQQVVQLTLHQQATLPFASVTCG